MNNDAFFQFLCLFCWTLPRVTVSEIRNLHDLLSLHIYVGYLTLKV